jgi:predicted exporter
MNGEFRSAWNDALRAAGLSVKRLGSLSPAATIGKLAPPAEVDQILSGQVVPSPRGEALVIWLGPHHPAAVAAAIADLPGVRYFSQRDLLDQMAQRYRDRALVMLGAGLAVIYLLLSIRYRSARKGLLSLLPALIATCSIFVAWAALGEAISFVHVMCLLLAVSICEDYGIFYLDNGGGDIHTTYQAIAPSMLTTAVSFAALGLADNPTLRVMSVAVTFGVLIGFLLCPLLIAPHDGRAREV